MPAPQRIVLWIDEVVDHLMEVALDVARGSNSLYQVHLYRVHYVVVLSVLWLLLLLH